ncbi:MAG: hypothetical protein V1928_00750 [Parcubacteria group bacterium]
MKKKKPKSFLEIFSFVRLGELLQSLNEIRYNAEKMKAISIQLGALSDSILKKSDNSEVLLVSSIFGLSELHLEVCQALDNMRIFCIGDLIMQTKKKLVKIGLDSNQIAEIELVLRNHDLRLGMTKKDIESWISHKNRAKKAM